MSVRSKQKGPRLGQRSSLKPELAQSRTESSDGPVAATEPSRYLYYYQAALSNDRTSLEQLLEDDEDGGYGEYIALVPIVAARQNNRTLLSWWLRERKLPYVLSHDIAEMWSERRAPSARDALYHVSVQAPPVLLPCLKLVYENRARADLESLQSSSGRRRAITRPLEPTEFVFVERDPLFAALLQGHLELVDWLQADCELQSHDLNRFDVFTKVLCVKAPCKTIDWLLTNVTLVRAHAHPARIVDAFVAAALFSDEERLQWLAQAYLPHVPDDLLAFLYARVAAEGNTKLTLFFRSLPEWRERAPDCKLRVWTMVDRFAELGRWPQLEEYRRLELLEPQISEREARRLILSETNWTDPLAFDAVLRLVCYYYKFTVTQLRPLLQEMSESELVESPCHQVLRQFLAQQGYKS